MKQQNRLPEEKMFTTEIWISNGIHRSFSHGLFHIHFLLNLAHSSVCWIECKWQWKRQKRPWDLHLYSPFDIQISVANICFLWGPIQRKTQIMAADHYCIRFAFVLMYYAEYRFLNRGSPGLPRIGRKIHCSFMSRSCSGVYQFGGGAKLDS